MSQTHNVVRLEQPSLTARDRKRITAQKAYGTLATISTPQHADDAIQQAAFEGVSYNEIGGSEYDVLSALKTAYINFTRNTPFVEEATTKRLHVLTERLKALTTLKQKCIVKQHAH